MKLNPSKSNAELFQLDLWSHRSRRAAPFVRLATLGPPERSFPTLLRVQRGGPACEAWSLQWASGECDTQFYFDNVARAIGSTIQTFNMAMKR